MRLTSATTVTHGKRLIAALVCCLTLPWVAQSAAADAGASMPSTAQLAEGSASAAVVECVTAATPGERSVTFSGEMTGLAGATRMSMRIELLERMHGEAGFHTVVAPGLGVWRAADPGVKVYKYLKQVANLSAPAAYRAAVVFRWQGPHGHLIRRTERLTRYCRQPLPTPPPTEPTTPTAGPPSTG